MVFFENGPHDTLGPQSGRNSFKHHPQLLARTQVVRYQGCVVVTQRMHLDRFNADVANRCQQVDFCQVFCQQTPQVAQVPTRFCRADDQFTALPSGFGTQCVVIPAHHKGCRARIAGS